MFCFVGCEAMCSKLILARLGHHLPYRRCLGYSFTGFYVSSITPSSTGGQPAQIYYMSKDSVPAAHGSLNMMLIAVCYQVVTLGYAVAAFLLLPSVRTGMGAGLGLLLLYGGAMMLILTAGMLCMMFLPNAAQRFTGGLVSLGGRLRLVRHEAQTREKLARQMDAYREGAACIPGKPESSSRPAADHLSPAHRPLCRTLRGLPGLRPARASASSSFWAPRPWSPWQSARSPSPERWGWRKGAP